MTGMKLSDGENPTVTRRAVLSDSAGTAQKKEKREVGDSAVPAVLGLNELKIAHAIEESFSSPKKFHIQVVKSRELYSAISFFTNVSMVLKMHGFILRSVSSEDLSKENSDNINAHRTVFVLDESVFLRGSQPDGQVLGSISEVFSSPIFSSFQRINAILVLSDAVYAKLMSQIDYLKSVDEQSSNAETSGTLSSENVTPVSYSRYGILLLGLAFILPAAGFVPASDFTLIPGLTLHGALSNISLILSIAGIVAIFISSRGRTYSGRGSALMAATIYLAILLLEFLVKPSSLIPAIQISHGYVIYPEIFGYVNSHVNLLLVAEAVVLAISTRRIPLMVMQSGSRQATSFSIKGGTLLGLGVIVLPWILMVNSPGAVFQSATSVIPSIQGIFASAGVLWSNFFLSYSSLSPYYYLLYTSMVASGDIFLFASYALAFMKMGKNS